MPGVNELINTCWKRKWPSFTFHLPPKFGREQCLTTIVLLARKYGHAVFNQETQQFQAKDLISVNPTKKTWWWCDSHVTWKDHNPNPLQWRHNWHDGVLAHQPHDCLPTVYSRANQRKHQSSASLAIVWGIHRWPVNSRHKGPVTRKMFSFDDVIMPSLLCIYIFLIGSRSSWQIFSPMYVVMIWSGVLKE